MVGTWSVSTTSNAFLTKALESDVLPPELVIKRAIESGDPSSSRLIRNLGFLTLVMLSESEIPESSSVMISGSDEITKGDVSTFKVIRLST